MKKRGFRIMSIMLFILGVLFSLNTVTTATGAAIGRGISGTVSSVAGLIFLLSSVVLFILGERLDEQVEKEHQWRKYSLLKKSIFRDVEQEYLSVSESPLKHVLIQDLIEKVIRGGRALEEETVNKKRTYEEQFYEGHAAQGGRVIDVESHLGRQGKQKGKLIHFGQPANGRYLWIVDEEGNFIVANRQTFHHEMLQMNQEKIDYFHRLHKLPHATLARGKSVYGSGEVLIEGGLVKEYNTASGHYVDLKDIEGFNEQGKAVFGYFIKKAGWKEVKAGAKYRFKEFRR